MRRWSVSWRERVRRLPTPRGPARAARALARAWQARAAAPARGARAPGRRVGRGCLRRASDQWWTGGWPGSNLHPREREPRRWASGPSAGTRRATLACSRRPPDAPAALHLVGDDGLLDRAAQDGAVAIVGSRRASRYGLEIARSLARDLAACEVPVVSGMAWGVDCGGARGRAVRVRPDDRRDAGRRRRRLSERQADAAPAHQESGLVVAEMPLGMRPFRWSFPARNRIMAALGRMTIVVEGAEGSGSLITAGFAQDLGREVGAVPGQVTNRLAAGPNRLLSEGAAVIRSADRRARCAVRAGRPAGSGRRGGRRQRTARGARETTGAATAQVAGGRGDRHRHRGGLGRERGGRRGAGRALGARVPRLRGPWARRGLRAPPVTAASRAYPAIPHGKCAFKHAACAVDRRIGLGRWCGHPGGPEGVRPLRRARDDRDHGGHVAEHGRGRAASPRSRRRRSSGQVRAVADDIGVDAVKIGMLGSVETIEAVRAALELVGDVPVVLDPGDGGRERRAPARAGCAPGAASSCCRSRPSITPNLLEARALVEEAGVGNGEGPEELAAALSALGPRLRGGHRRAWPGRGGGRPVLGRRARGGDRRPAVSGRRGARLGLHALLGAGCTPRARPRPARGGAWRRSASPRRRCATGSRDIGAGPGPVDALGIAARRP